ncbi:MAG: hypothetical protein PQJ60_12825 [Spirochaetales bacterium]|nr:hypothetical protein [Spirochaetales bacterium]
MNLRKQVVKSRENDYEKMGGVVESMRNVVRHFRVADLPSEEFTLDDLKAYISHIIDIQEEDGTWTVSAHPEQLSEDEKVEFVSFPSFLGVSTLVMAEEYLPDEDFPGREDALEKGFAALKLEGYGEDSLFQMIEMILILIEAAVPPWLKSKRSRQVYNHTAVKLISFRDRLQSRLDAGDTILSFGGDYREIFELVTAGLSVL